jgi:hypothetical protein
MLALEVTTRERPALQIHMRCFQEFAVVSTVLALAPFGVPATVFWIYVCASLLFLVGLIKVLNELPQEHNLQTRWGVFAPGRVRVAELRSRSEL